MRETREDRQVEVTAAGRGRGGGGGGTRGGGDLRAVMEWEVTGERNEASGRLAF